MRIVWVFERTDQLWGGVKVALEDANWLASRGHQVTVVSGSQAPEWMQVRCGFRSVSSMEPDQIPPADLYVGTFWTTVPAAAAAAAAHGGTAVHYCQGYEGDNPENEPYRAHIEAVYRLPGVQHVTISPHLTQLLRNRFGLTPREVVYTVDHSVHFPGEERPAPQKLRVGLVGPYAIPWKDIATGIEACRLAAAAGQQLELVRASNTPRHAAEQNLPFPVEWHENVPPAAMGDFYRTLDVFLGTSSGPEEGFFLPAVEAMACGVPTVLTDVPCFRGHGEGFALLVPPRDPVAMAEALIVAARAPDVRTSLRKAGLRTAARYTPAAHGQALEAALRDIAAAARAPQRSAPPNPATARAGAATSTAGPRPAPRSNVGVEDQDPTQKAGELVASLRRGAAHLAERRDHVRAADWYEAAHCLRRDDADLASEVAWQHHLAGDTTAALRLLDEMVHRGGDAPPLHHRRGLVLHSIGRAADAAQAFRAAIAAGGRSADAYNNLGVVLFQSGDVPGAKNSFERALAIEPNHADATANLRDLTAV